MPGADPIILVNHSQNLESEVIAHGLPIRSLFAGVHAPPHLLDDA